MKKYLISFSLMFVLTNGLLINNAKAEECPISQGVSAHWVEIVLWPSECLKPQCQTGELGGCRLCLGSDPSNLKCHYPNNASNTVTQEGRFIGKGDNWQPITATESRCYSMTKDQHCIFEQD